jgi:hypothetical protein
LETSISLTFRNPCPPSGRIIGDFSLFLKSVVIVPVGEKAKKLDLKNDFLAESYELNGYSLGDGIFPVGGDGGDRAISSLDGLVEEIFHEFARGHSSDVTGKEHPYERRGYLYTTEP